MNGECIDKKTASVKMCPYRVFQEEHKAGMMGSGDRVVQSFYPCLQDGCAVYHDGICLRAAEALKNVN